MPPNVRRGFAASPPQRGSALPNGRRASCGTASSLLSDKGVPLEQIARLVGHTGGSTVTETVYRKQLRPVINDGAVTMNELFPRGDRYSARYSPEPTRSKRPGLER